MILPIINGEAKVAAAKKNCIEEEKNETHITNEANFSIAFNRNGFTLL